MTRTAWIAAVVSVALLLSGIVAAAFVVGGSNTKNEPPVVTVGSSTGQFALPLADNPSALMVAKHDRDLLVGIAARPGGPVEIVALRAETPIAVHIVRIDGREVAPRGCGVGCTAVEGAVMRGSRDIVLVQVGRSKVRFELPARLPRDGERLFLRMRRTMLALRSYRFVEKLSSGGKPFVATFEVWAPNRLRYSTPGGSRAVIIGSTRWDYLAGRWQRTSYSELHLPAYMWDKAGQARVLGRGHGLTELAAYAREPVPAWFRLEVDRKGRVITADMIAASHFMHHDYDSFDKAPPITPPTKK